MAITSGTSRKTISIHGFTARVEYPGVLDERIQIVFSGYPDAGDDCIPDLVVDIAQDPLESRIWRVSYAESSHLELDEARTACRAEWLVVTQALRSWSSLIHVHAALVGNKHKSVLLIGESGSGKSTTSVALASLGLTVYSDDVAIVERGSLRAFTCPRPIKLDEASRSLLGPHGVVVSPDQAVGESVGRLFLPGFPQVERPGAPVSGAFFFAQKRAPDPRITPLSKSEAALRLMRQSSTDVDSVHGLTPEAFGMIEQLTCFELHAGELMSTARLIRDWIEHA